MPSNTPDPRIDCTRVPTYLYFHRRRSVWFRTISSPVRFVKRVPPNTCICVEHPDPNRRLPRLWVRAFPSYRLPTHLRGLSKHDFTAARFREPQEQRGLAAAIRGEHRDCFHANAFNPRGRRARLASDLACLRLPCRVLPSDVQLMGPRECVRYMVIILRWALTSRCRSTTTKPDRINAVIPRSVVFEPSWPPPGRRLCSYSDRLRNISRALWPFHTLCCASQRCGRSH